MSSISLEEVVARGTSIHWDEAVAIVEELCHALLGASGDRAHVPSLADVVIGAVGEVTMQRTRGDKSPTAAGRMLHTLLVNANDVPMPLRLFVMQSTAPETHATLREFAKGLSYYGKPDRTQLIRDVYARATALPQSNGDAVVPPPLPAVTPQESPASPNRPARRRLRRVAIAAVLLLVVGGTWIWTGGNAGQGTKGGAAQMLSDAAAKLSELGQQVRETLAAKSEAPAPPSTRETIAFASKRSRRLTSPPADAPKPLASRPVITRRREMWKLAAASPTAIARPEVVDVYEPSLATEVADTPVYSADDSDVEPPVLLYPHVKPAAARAAESAVNRMVLIVATDGSVERVQLVDGPSRMPDMMLLSGAKTWKFAPATKDGEAVRYQTVLTWTGRP